MVILATKSREIGTNPLLDANCTFDANKDREFSIKIARCNWTGDMTFGNLVYVPDTEFGGIIEDVLTDTSLDYVELKGYTWRGRMEMKVIEFTLPFETDLLEEAYVTIAQRGTVVIEKSIDECTLKHDMLSVRLPQEETLKLIAQRNSRAEIQLRVLTRDGEALASNIETVDVGRILKDGVI